MKKIVLIGLPLLTNLYFCSTAAQELNTPIKLLPPIHKIYVFGDSLSDTGNLEAATLSFLPNANNYFMGRFSDGYLWIDDLAENYHTTVQDNQFIKNYAVGGATAFPYVNQVSIFHWGYYLVGSLGNQLYQFTKTYHKFEPDDLVIVWIGANDLLWAGDMYFCGKLTKACIEGQVEKPDQTIIVQRAAHVVQRQVQKMEKDGAKHIILIGLPDFSIVPRYIFQQPAIAALKKADVTSYNDKLKTFVNENQAQGHDILFYDLNKLLQGLIHNKAEQAQDKITDVVHSCLYRNQEPQAIWESMALDRYNPLSMYAVIPVFRDALSGPNYYRSGGFKEFVDKKCGNSYLFWDTLHPTKKGHFIIFQHLLNYIHSHFNLSRANTDIGFCYNLQVINKGWYVLDVSQKNNPCGPKNTYMLKNNEKLVSVEYNKPVKFKAVLGKSITFFHLPTPIQGLGAKIKCTGTTIIDFSCKQTT
ncbi:SGNH/GDSL hydrolase family protein [Rickettsiella endosymbiont of Litargus connexus]|jgi:phospholipase/lecithinase/hemolysin|uniref:SGNH/GDSL hydrolase family protein n=1 Tax=Rickettsiella endosymbiont of Litargus connexus TaxID=3066237 RepID=UPI00376EA755|nr:SGNH/GDSL hydrolase family protein [Gammaproteobacteria bacterium]MCH9754273.1 SGNH/GDSL hydrolase family protein [Gammaproteobacteria bacterium]